MKKIIEQVSKYYNKNSKLPVCLVQQCPPFRAHFIPWDFKLHTYTTSYFLLIKLVIHIMESSNSTFYWMNIIDLQILGYLNIFENSSSRVLPLCYLPAMDWTVSSHIPMLKPYPRDLRMWLHLEIKPLKRRFSLNEAIRVDPSPICPGSFKKKCEHTKRTRSMHAQGKDHMKTQREDSYLQAKEKPNLLT